MSAANPNASGSVSGGQPVKFNAVKVFSATMVADRDQLGDRVTGWMKANPSCKVTDFVVTQSSDESFHCITITVFYWQDLGGRDDDDDDYDDDDYDDDDRDRDRDRD
jgi:hypothetical protein